MNRFTNYLDGQRLAKQCLVSAESFRSKGNSDKAVKMLIEAMREQMMACNNIASLYFEHRKKR